MKTSALGLSLIKKYEGLELKAYRCPANILTIGYGHTGSDVFEGMEITEDEATELLKKDVLSAEKTVNRLCNGLINQNQFDALVSFVYNCGSGNFSNSTLLKRIKTNTSDALIRDAFMMWIKANGKVLKGLQKRREEEANLFLS